MSTDESTPIIITAENFRGLYSKHGFTQAERGARAVLDETLKEQITHLTKLGMLQADHEGHSGLSRENALKAVEMTPEIPKGIY